MRLQIWPESPTAESATELAKGGTASPIIANSARLRCLLFDWKAGQISAGIPQRMMLVAVLGKKRRQSC
ncbi:hypothetical protein L2Y90_06925 [Burkholderia pyrrocinia]|uniref:hypothetical protein n=1 Tax=Burkholderia pyrrocinia TaxID=60550 RepID=UPI00215AB824|nr:hypothetical protein [Burkholderia pyrrocinia]UVE66840.1 hypothetical protein L2Y90_06925 [Burkholderia pyrrocinia]